MSESVDVAVGVLNGKVLARWRDPTSEIEFDARNAYQIGLALCRAAMQAHRGSPGAKDVQFLKGELAEVKKTVSDLERMAMIQKVATIVRTMVDRNAQAGTIAAHAVDAVLRDVAR